MRYETHSADQFMYWRHTWRCWHDGGIVSEFEAIEYKPGPLSQHAHDNPGAFEWVDDTPWNAELIADHSPVPLHAGHQPVPGHCALLDVDTCFYVLGNVTAADALLTVWLNNNRDNDVVWLALRARNPLVAS